MARNLGQYSVVTYVHDLRGERINLGVLVWHPMYGCVFRAPRSVSRVRSIDESADLGRVRIGIERIKEAAETWSRGDESPLENLSREFRHRLVVTNPLNARIQDPLAALERLSATLIPPEPSYTRAPSTKQFARAFARHLEEAFEKQGLSGIRSDFIEEDTFEPIEVTASYRHNSGSYLWRAVSFASENDLRGQLRLAKSTHGENIELRSLEKYQDAHLLVAVQLPKPRARGDWDKALKWLHRASDRVEPIEDRNSLEAKVPKLLPSDLLSPTLVS
jgi:hypothetical protein